MSTHHPLSLHFYLLFVLLSLAKNDLVWKSSPFSGTHPHTELSSDSLSVVAKPIVANHASFWNPICSFPRPSRRHWYYCRPASCQRQHSWNFRSFSNGKTSSWRTHSFWQTLPARAHSFRKTIQSAARLRLPITPSYQWFNARWTPLLSQHHIRYSNIFFPFSSYILIRTFNATTFFKLCFL